LPDGQLSRIPVPSLREKYFPFDFQKIMIIVTPSRLDEEGRIAIVTTRGARDAVDARHRQTGDVLRTAKACGIPWLMLSLEMMISRRR
jgi:hypothetical protein